MKTIKNHTGRGMMARRVAYVSLGAAAAITALLSVTQATPPSSIVSGTVLARASFTAPTDILFNIKEGRAEVIHVREAQETVMQQIIIGPGGSTGWHSHPGPAIVLIKSGELTVYSSDDPACTGWTYSAGQAFVEHGQGLVQLARNLSPSENVELWVTYFDVPPGGPFRLDAADPGNCRF